MSAPVLLAKASLKLPSVHVFCPLLEATSNPSAEQVRMPLLNEKSIVIWPVKLTLPTPPKKSSCGSGRGTVSADANAVARSTTANSSHLEMRIQSPTYRHE